MKKLYIFLLIPYSLFLTPCIAQNINTYAGNGIPGWAGDGGQATNAELKGPCGIWIDASDNLFIGDESNSRLRMVTSTGVITTVAGNGVFGYSGDGGPATAAELSDDQGVCTDAIGRIYICDFSNARIRMVGTAGLIKTIAGNGHNAYSGDGGPATLAEINAPSGIVVDSNGNVYIADEANNRIRMINAGDTITTFAGNGAANYSGDGGPATSAEISNVTGVGIDINNNIYIADLGNRRVRKVTTSDTISTIAGNGVSGYSGDGGPATIAELDGPTGVCVDGSGNIYIGDQFKVRKVTPAGTITTVAGNGTSGYSGDGGPATSAEFNYSFGVCMDIAGNLFLSDVFNSRVREVTFVSTGIPERLSNANVVLYPNPNNGHFTMQLSVVSSQWSVEIYNVIGEMVYRSAPHTSRNEFGTGSKGALSEIDLSNQEKGIYFYKVTSETGEVIGTGKFIIE